MNNVWLSHKFTVATICRTVKLGKLIGKVNFFLDVL